MPITPPPGWRTASGGVAVGAGEVSGDQRLGELLLARHELDTVCLELVVGRTALVESDTGSIAAGGTLDGAIEVPAATGGVGVEIRNAAGQVVRHLQLGPQPAGLTRFHWDGLDDAGAAVAAGPYEIVAGYQKNNTAEAAATLIDAPVDSVVFGADGFMVQLRGIGELPFSAVREIRNDPI